MDKIQHCRVTPQLSFKDCPKCGTTLEEYFHDGKRIHRCPKCNRIIA